MRKLLGLAVLSLVLTSCTSTKYQPAAAPARPATVVWVSIDGFRHDYLDRIKPPFLTKMAHEGAFTNQETPIFPSLTFPNHAAQVTGRTVDGSGIPSNAFYDQITRQSYYLPEESSLLRAEPIWVTAKKQGVRSAIIDWPMSHKQTGEFTADYFGNSYDKKETDPHRLQRVVDTLTNDTNGPPIRLVMTYVFSIDSAAHKYGPDSPEVAAKVLEIDTALADFTAKTTEWFDTTHSREDELYFVFTTDHGMQPIETTVNLERLLGELSHDLRINTSGPIATLLTTDKTTISQREQRIQAIIDKLKSYPYIDAWKSAKIPAKYHIYTHGLEDRLGEIFVSLPPGYSFTSIRTGATEPATTKPVQPLKGNHGYDPAICPNMLGTAIVWRYRHPQGGRDLGVVENTQWAATVDRLLNISPAGQSDLRAVDASSR